MKMKSRRENKVLKKIVNFRLKIDAEFRKNK